MSAIRVTAVQLSPGGTSHADIERVRWIEDGTATEHVSSAAALVRWIISGGDCAYLQASTGRMAVSVVRGVVAYPRAHDGLDWTDHLLQLPRFAQREPAAAMSSS